MATEVKEKATVKVFLDKEKGLVEQKDFGAGFGVGKGAENVLIETSLLERKIEKILLESGVPNEIINDNLSITSNERVVFKNNDIRKIFYGKLNDFFRNLITESGFLNEEEKFAIIEHSDEENDVVSNNQLHKLSDSALFNYMKSLSEKVNSILGETESEVPDGYLKATVSRVSSGYIYIRINYNGKGGKEKSFKAAVKKDSVSKFDGIKEGEILFVLDKDKDATGENGRPPTVEAFFPEEIQS